MFVHSFRKLLVVCSIAFTILPGFSLAHSPDQPPHQTFEMGHLKLESGEVIENFVMSYVTHGKLNENKSNAILMAPALGGNHHRIDFLIGQGKALDTEKYFIICADSIGNGLSTSPSNSKTQAGPKFPKFNIRDMVYSQYRLVTEKFGIKRLVAVAGASMGGFQAIQWAVSYPDALGSVVALTGAARSSAWFIGVLHLRNQVLMLDPAYNEGNYKEPPGNGWRLFSNVSYLVGVTPEGANHMFPNGKDIIPFLTGQGDSMAKRPPDANNQIYQTYACFNHHVGETPGFNGDLVKALKSIKAKTLLLLARNDVLVPIEQVKQDAKYIKDVRVEEIPTMFGHLGASASYSPADVDYCNRIVREFLNDATNFGRNIK
ncbi:MAG: alpha/beta fold hydrolase [Deltaproteobacteria bacterium]|nr:alpha/beta fold hydrolase [Deltaproteobacteria bacterium]